MDDIVCNSCAMSDYTLKNLGALEDMAVKGGFSDFQEARFAGKDLELETLGISSARAGAAA